MTLKGDAKPKEKLTYNLKNDISNLVNFHVSRRKFKNLHFNWIFLSKAYKDLDEKIQKNYVSWQWRVMQSLKKNWDSWFQKRYKEFGKFPPNHSKFQKFHFDGLSLSKAFRFGLKKYRGFIFHGAKQWCKIFLNPNHVISKMTWGIGWNFIIALKVWKTVHWKALFVQSI